MSADNGKFSQVDQEPKEVRPWKRIQVGEESFGAQFITNEAEITGDVIRAALQEGHKVFISARDWVDFYGSGGRIAGSIGYRFFPFGELVDNGGQLGFKDKSVITCASPRMAGTYTNDPDKFGLVLESVKVAELEGRAVRLNVYVNYGSPRQNLGDTTLLIVKESHDSDEEASLTPKEDKLAKLFAISHELYPNFKDAANDFLDQQKAPRRDENAKKRAAYLAELSETIRRAKETSPWSDPE